jgi:hypothetical protein
LRSERTRASALVCQAIASEHRRLAADICAKLAALHRAHINYRNLADALNEDGVNWTELGPMGLACLGDPRNPNGEYAAYLRRAAHLGVIAPRDLPPELS